MGRERIVRMKLLLVRTGLSRATIYRRIAAGRFPPPIDLGERSRGWYESDVDCWIANPAGYRSAPLGGEEK